MDLNLLKLLMFASKQMLYIFIIQVLAINFLSANTSNGQRLDKVIVSIQIENATLEEIFTKLEGHTNFTFAYHEGVISDNQRLSLSYNKVSLLQILNTVSAEANLRFKRINQTISVTKKHRLRKNKKTQEIANIGITQTISGTVVDENNESIPGVNIILKGTTKGTTTDIQGRYSLEVPDNEVVLTVSFIGYKTQEIKITNNTEINITLKLNITSLDEVVITGYGDISKRLFTGSSVSISAEEVKVDGVIDVSRMLEGRAAGVNVQNVSGTFGAGPKITIRGASSVTGDTKPLWVIDGVVQEDLVDLSFDDLVSGDPSTLIGSSVAGLNSNDISSFEILKDASATAIYGARALNGVIVITTKKGVRNAPLKFNYQGEFTTRNIPNYRQANILDSKETLAVLLQQDKYKNDLATIVQDRYSGIFGILSQQLGEYNSATGEFSLKNDLASRNKFLQEYERANTDWFNTLFKQSVTHNHTFSISGGGENNQFYVSLGYYGDAGWTLADNVNRVTANFKNTSYLSEKATLTISLLSSFRQQEAPGTFRLQSDIVSGTVTRDFDINPYSYALNTNRLLRPRDSEGNLEFYTNNWASFNILHELENNRIELDVQDTKLQLDFQHKFLQDKLSYAITGAARVVKSTTQHIITGESNVAGAYRATGNGNTQILNANIFLYQDPEDLVSLPEVVLPNGGIFIKTDNELNNFYFRNTLNFSDVFNLKHDVEGFIGQEVRYIDREEISFSGYGLQYSRGYVPFTDPRIIEKIVQGGEDYFGVSQTRERTASFFSRATYGYNGKYYISFTGNINASNRVGASDGGVNWLPTWTISGKWNIFEEPFIDNINFLSNAQIRVSHGLTANTGNATNALPVFRSRITDRRDFDDREGSIFIGNLQNRNLSWEKQFETNLGIDVGFLSNRINLTVDVYNRQAFDLIDFVRVSGIGGESFKQINNADMTTKGLEISLRTINVTTGDFKWSSTVNFSYFDQEVTKLASRPRLLNLVDATGSNLVGFPRNAIFSIQFTGLDDRGLPTFDIPDGDKIAGIDFQDTGEDIEASEGKPAGLLSYLKYEGPSDPNKVMSLQNSFSYKNWSLGIFISASTGNKIRLPQSFSSTYSDVDVVAKNFINRWALPGDEKMTNIPVVAHEDLLVRNTRLNRAYNAYNFSTENIADGGFIRLKTISLSYKLPQRIIDKIGFNSLSTQFLVQNPLLIYSDKKLNGVDPEFFGVGGVAYPITRQFTFSMNIGI